MLKDMGQCTDYEGLGDSGRLAAGRRPLYPTRKGGLSCRSSSRGSDGVKRISFSEEVFETSIGHIDAKLLGYREGSGSGPGSEGPGARDGKSRRKGGRGGGGKRWKR